MGSAVSIRSDVVAEKKYMTPIPHSIIIVSVIRLEIDSTSMAAMGTSESRKALDITDASPLSPGMMEIPITSDRTAPKDAPDETPIVYGSAKGFLITACMTDPQTPRAKPVITAIMLDVRRTSQTTKSVRSPGGFPVRWDRIILSTSPGDTSYAPKAGEAISIAVRRAAMAMTKAAFLLRMDRSLGRKSSQVSKSPRILSCARPRTRTAARR